MKQGPAAAQLDGYKGGREKVKIMQVKGTNLKHWWRSPQYNLRLGTRGKRTHLEVSELSEQFAAVIESAEVGLGPIMNDLVGTYIAALGETFPTDLAVIWALSSMSSFMCL